MAILGLNVKSLNDLPFLPQFLQQLGVVPLIGFLGLVHKNDKINLAHKKEAPVGKKN